MLFITKETALCTDPNRICCICREGAQADERSSPLHLPLSRFRFFDTDHVRWPLRERCKLMLNGLLSDRRKLQTRNEKGENAPTNAQRSAIIQQRHAEGERCWKPSLAAIWCCQCGWFAPIGGVGNWRGIVILWLKIGLEAGSPEEKPRQAPGERDSGIKPATFLVRGRRCSQQQPLPHLLNRDIAS